MFSAAGIGLDVHKLEEVILLGMMHLSHSLFDIAGCFMDVGA